MRERAFARSLGVSSLDLGPLLSSVRPSFFLFFARKPMARLWSDEQVNVLMEATNRGLSASDIAHLLTHKFGKAVSRAAVIGKWFRLGLDIAATRGAATRTPRTPRTPRRERALPPLRPEPYAIRAGLPPAVATKRFADLEPDDCRWPVGNPGEPTFGFCASPRIPGLPYCETCCRRAYLGAPPRTMAQDAVAQVVQDPVVPIREPVPA